MKFFILFTILSIFGFASAQYEGFCLDKETCCIGKPIAHPLGDWDDCTVFYLCFGDAPTEYTCPESDPLYDPVNNVCVPDGEVVDGCIQGTRQPIYTTTEAIITTSSLPGHGNCTEDGVYYIAYPGDCSKYMICAYHELLPEAGQCAPGTLFDPDLEDCNLESLVECRPTCPDDGVSYIPHEKNCNQYWLCTAGIPTLRICPDGLVFDPKLNSCNLADQVFCPNLCPPDAITINLPHSNNCSMYWLCVYGDPTLRQCPPGLLFDPNLGQCNAEDQVECFQSF